MMAEASPRDKELFTEQELTCSICLDLFSDPVSTPCGHNFCQGCIGGYWASSSVCTCPLCKRQFPERPQLSINRVFAHIADKFKETRYGAAGMTLLPMSTVVPGSNTNPFLEEVVLCDVCTGKKQAAVSSCLTCTASYCEEHLKPHRTTPFYASHQLLDPLEALRGRTCPIHHRLLEVFCRTDQACICAICSLHEHRTHNTVSIQTERIVKQKLLGKTELEIQKRVEGKRLHLAELKEKLETIRNYARSEVSEMEHLLGELALAVERIRSELVGGMEEKRISVETLAEEQVACVEAELTELQQRRAALEEQATSQDHVSFLKTFQQANMPAVPDPDVDLEREPSLHFSLDEVKLALVEVKERMDDIHMGEVQPRGSHGSITSLPESESMMSVSGLRKSQWSLRDLKKIKPKSGLKKVKCYQEDVTLNPVTAYPFLILSDDRKQVKRGEKLQFYRNSSHRFDVWSCVLAKEGFNSGRHYWEVNVGENKDWKVGVVKESAQRKGLFDMSPVSGYYALWWGGTQLRALTTPPLTKVKSPIRLRRVGVYLDCEEGQVTFYNAKTGNEVHSFNVSEFSERMFPLLGTGDKEVPLVLMTAQYSSVPE